MLFSILIPTYNNERTIVRTVYSAINQTYKDKYEIIVLDNASTDDTNKLLSNIIDDKLIVKRNLHTVNLYANHNIALKYAKGDYVVFCHGDDELLPHALQVLEQHIAKSFYPTRYIAIGHSMFRDFSATMQGHDSLLKYNDFFSGRTAKMIFMSGGTTPSGTCYSRKSFVEIGGFDATDGAYESDWIAFLKGAFEGFEFEFIDRMIFKREFASTYVVSNQSKILEQRLLSQQRFIGSLSSMQKEEFEMLYWEREPYVWRNFFTTPPPTKQERLDAILKRYKQKPWCIWKLVKWILIKCNIWK